MLKGRIANRRLYDYLASGVSGCVLAAFSGGVYLSLENETVMIHDVKNGFIPFGIAVSDFDGRGKSFGIEPEMQISVCQNILVCNGANFQVKIGYEEPIISKLALSDFALFSSTIPLIQELHKRSALSVYSNADVCLVSKECINDIFARAAYEGLSCLSDAIKLQNEVLIETALDKLIGLGRGLTPSLDDFICGMLFLMHLYERTTFEKLPWLELLSNAVINSAGNKTNVYSAAYLQAAARGEDFSALRSCIENISKDDAYSSINNVFQIGSSSGADMLCGMSFAANYIMKQRNFTQ